MVKYYKQGILFKQFKTWHDINWRQVFKYVARLQKEMVVAFRKVNLNKVHRLQYKLMMSFEARAYSVRKITSNEGKFTPGIDGIVISTPQDKLKAIQKLRYVMLNPKKYKPGLIKRVWIPKVNSKELRPLGIPPVLDRMLQAVVHLALDPIIEEISDQYSYGSRKYRSPHDAITRVRTLLDKPKSPKWILDLDISKCFDNIKHNVIIEKVNPLFCSVGRSFINKWLKAGVVEKGTIIYPRKGVPQGGVISPLLCNLVLNGIDEIIRPGLPKHDTQAYKELAGCWAVRYVDDIIITGPTRDKILEYVPKIYTFLDDLGLEVSSSKTSIINLKENSFEYLGFKISLSTKDFKQINLSGKVSPNKYLLKIEPTNKDISRIKYSIRSAFRKKWPLIRIIKELNPVIRGWTNYYRISTHSMRVFSRLSNYIYTLWWIWARRFHPTRNKTWIVKKYVHRIHTKRWQLGPTYKLVVFDPIKVTVHRVAAVKMDKNPYTERDYFERRYKNFNLDKFRKAVYVRHKYKCAACNELLDDSEAVELHHIIPRYKGGKYTLDNIVPLHKTCHGSVTYARKEWFKNLNLKK